MIIQVCFYAYIKAAAHLGEKQREEENKIDQRRGR